MFLGFGRLLVVRWLGCVLHVFGFAKLACHFVSLMCLLFVLSVFLVFYIYLLVLLSLYSPTSFGRLKRLRGALWAFSLAVEHPDLDAVEAVGVQTRNLALRLVPTEDHHLDLLGIRIVLQQALLPPVVHLGQMTSTVTSILLS